MVSGNERSLELSDKLRVARLDRFPIVSGKETRGQLVKSREVRLVKSPMLSGNEEMLEHWLKSRSVTPLRYSIPDGRL